MRFSFVLLMLSVWTLAISDPAEAEAIRVSEFVELGGIQQWITIRGEDVRNPVLLLVHGGPGEAQWPSAHEYAPYEKDFVLVQWDQRGAGRTFAKNGDSTPEVNLDRISRDGTELAEYLRKRFNKTRIAILGHSWGSIVGIRMVSARPDLFAAYIGTGQVASWRASVNAQFTYLLTQARLRNDADYVRELQSIEKPDAANAQQYFQFSRKLREYVCSSDRRWLEGLADKARSSPDVSDKDLQDLIAGMNFSGPRLLKDQMATDLMASDKTFSVPFFVVQGQDDMFTPTSAAVSYFDQVEAPIKKLILVPGAGHFALLTHAQKFAEVLHEDVVPIVKKRSSKL